MSLHQFPMRVSKAPHLSSGPGNISEGQTETRAFEAIDYLMNSVIQRRVEKLQAEEILLRCLNERKGLIREIKDCMEKVRKAGI
jgi:hypothetical protein